MVEEMSIKEPEREIDREADATYQRALAAVERIVKESESDIETLETRNSDELDFHELSVWELKSLLLAAYYAGVNNE